MKEAKVAQGLFVSWISKHCHFKTFVFVSSGFILQCMQADK